MSKAVFLPPGVDLTIAPICFCGSVSLTVAMDVAMAVAGRCWDQTSRCLFVKTTMMDRESLDIFSISSVNSRKKVRKFLSRGKGTGDGIGVVKQREAKLTVIADWIAQRPT